MTTKKKAKPLYTLTIELRGPRRKIIKRIVANANDFTVNIENGRDVVSFPIQKFTSTTTISGGGIVARISHPEKYEEMDEFEKDHHRLTHAFGPFNY